MASGYYDITNKTLGKGHYGVVKLGRHCLTGEPVAIKIIEKSRLNQDSLTQLGTEIRILFRLSEFEHPNILKLYQTIDTEDKLFLITEYCGPHACDLHDYLSRKRCRDGLNGREAQVFFIQICSAISYCHSMGIVHRDLKPENILVTDYRHTQVNGPIDDQSGSSKSHDTQYPLLKLIDFGFANQWFPDEKMHTSCGTLAYSAPELLLGEAYDGTKVDVWGLGLMLYILLYGGNPFMQINDNETLTKILDCSFATPTKDNVDFSAVDLLRSLIKRNPETRLPMDAILKHNWFSSIPKTIDLMLKYQIKSEQSSVAVMKQLPKSSPQVLNSTLPSISESGPLKSLNRSADDDQVPTSLKEVSSETTSRPNYNRTRSLSITRTCTNATQQQSSLPHTKSSVSLERLNNSQNNSTIPNFISPKPLTRSSPLYRPTSPDVGGSILPTEEDSKLHDCVIQDMFRLTKLIDSKSSIEASLKNARFAHRQFNQNSIQPTQFNKRKSSPGIVRSLLGKGGQQGGEQLTTPTGEKPVSTADKVSIISNKLNNDDYIYATYQLTRDRIIRVKNDRLKKKLTKDQESVSIGFEERSSPDSDSTTPADELKKEQDAFGISKLSVGGGAKVFAKENDKSRLQQRKLLQPQHKMRDKFTSFFRSGSTSPSGSFSVSCDPHNSGDTSSFSQLNSQEVHHEAFNDHHNETSGSVSRYLTSKVEPSENSLAYALPLARKCSLVSEESGCSNDVPDNP